MNVFVIKMTLEERDSRIREIEEQIKKNQETFMKKRRIMNDLAKQNALLSGVRDDYNKYYGYIVTQKQDQLHAMEKLHQYLAYLAKSTDMTVNNIKDAAIEQDKILREMRKIKGELDEIVL